MTTSVFNGLLVFMLMLLTLHLFFLTVDGTWQPRALEPSVARSMFKIIFKRLASKIVHYPIPSAPQTPPTPMWDPSAEAVQKSHQAAPRSGLPSFNAS